MFIYFCYFRRSESKKFNSNKKNHKAGAWLDIFPLTSTLSPCRYINEHVYTSRIEITFCETRIFLLLMQSDWWILRYGTRINQQNINRKVNFGVFFLQNLWEVKHTCGTTKKMPPSFSHFVSRVYKSKHQQMGRYTDAFVKLSSASANFSSQCIIWSVCSCNFEAASSAISFASSKSSQNSQPQMHCTEKNHIFG